MKRIMFVCILFQAIYLGAAVEKLNYGEDGRITSVLLKKISDLEERDRQFGRKLEEIDVLKKRLDEAQRRLTNMQELEHRLQKAEERIRILENRVCNNNAACTMNTPAAIKVSDINTTHGNMDNDHSDPFWIRRAVANIESRQDEMSDKLAEIVSLKNRIQTVTNMAATKDIKRTVTRKAAFTAMFSSSPITITPGRSLLFDKVDYNEGNGYDARSGIFTCPVSGTYFFFTSIISMPNSSSVDSEIVVEGVGKGKAHAFKEVDYAQGSTAAALHCNAGDRVWVSARWGSKIFGELFSSFTGFLLWPDDTASSSN